MTQWWSTKYKALGTIPSATWWHTSTVPELGRWRQADQKFKAIPTTRKFEMSLSYMRLCHNSRNRPSTMHCPCHQLQHRLPLAKAHQPSIASRQTPSSPISKDPRHEPSATEEAALSAWPLDISNSACLRSNS